MDLCEWNIAIVLRKWSISLVRLEIGKRERERERESERENNDKNDVYIKDIYYR